MAATPDGRGYWLVNFAGQVYAFGGANYAGNAPMPLAGLSIGILAVPGGYRIVDTAGNIFERAVVQGQNRISSPTPFVAAG
jgi:hypothetical protein